MYLSKYLNNHLLENMLLLFLEHRYNVKPDSESNYEVQNNATIISGAQFL